VHTASRITDLAGPNEILVSRTVVELTAGSGLEFEPRGEHELKGVPGTGLTFAAPTGGGLARRDDPTSVANSDPLTLG